MDNKKMVLEGLKESISANIKVWNQARIDKNMDTMQKSDAELVKDVKEYAEVAQAICFDELRQREFPMLEAIKQLTYETLRVKEVSDSQTGSVHREASTVDKQIDLLKFDEFCKRDGGKTIAHVEDWNHQVQAFNLLMCLRAAVELKIDPKTVSDSYFMSEKAKEVNLGKTPTSNTAILKMLQACVDAIIYETGEHGNCYKASSKDVAYLLMIYTKKGKKALTAATAKHGAMRGFIMEICHRIVTDKAYRLEFKQAKEKSESTKSA